MWKNLVGIFLFVVFLASFSQTATVPDGRVVNGQRVSNKNYPFVVRMRYPTGGGYIIGTGSLISSKCVLTALHVVKGGNNIEACGGSDVDGSGMTCRQVKQYMYMPDIDLAVVVLRDPLQGNNIGTIQMDFNRVTADKWVQYVGWGPARYSGEASNRRYLNLVNFQVEPDNLCDGPYLMCYKDRGNWQDTEGGDSGGPVIYNNKQVSLLTGKRWSSSFSNSFGPRLSNDAIRNFVQSEFARNC